MKRVLEIAKSVDRAQRILVVGIDDINSQLFIYHNAFADLTSLVNALPEKSKLSPGALNLTTENGRYYCVPYVADMSVLWYNKTLFRRAEDCWSLQVWKRRFQPGLLLPRSTRSAAGDFQTDHCRCRPSLRPRWQQRWMTTACNWSSAESS